MQIRLQATASVLYVLHSVFGFSFARYGTMVFDVLLEFRNRSGRLLRFERIYDALMADDCFIPARLFDTVTKLLEKNL